MSRSASLFASGCLLLTRSVHQGGQVSRGEVGQLHSQLGVLQDGICEDLLIPQADVGVALEHLGILGGVRAPRALTPVAHVLEVEDAAMLVTLVTKSKMDTGAVLGSSPHDVGHDTGYVEG